MLAMGIKFHPALIYFFSQIFKSLFGTMHVLAPLLLTAFLPAAIGQLNTLAKQKGLKYFGSATDNGELSDTTYVSILSNTSQFGQITPGNTQKWVFTEPSQNTFSWSQGDVITSFAEGNGQMLRCRHSPL